LYQSALLYRGVIFTDESVILADLGHPCCRALTYFTFMFPTAGVRVDAKVPHANGIRGFLSVLQQISKVLNRTSVSKGTSKTSLNYSHSFKHVYF